MKWKLPSITKVYEALGTIADGRVKVAGDTGKVYSSSGNKFYDISFDLMEGAIMSNDNSSYWQGTLGYPAIAFLMKIGVLSYDQKMGDILKGIAWKDINQKFKNNFEKALDSVLESKSEKERSELKNLTEQVMEEIKELDLSYLGPKKLPPAGY